jgi:hypothetical protein
MVGDSWQLRQLGHEQGTGTEIWPDCHVFFGENIAENFSAQQLG